MSLNLQINDNVITAYLLGELDHHTAKIMREKIDDVCNRNKPEVLIIDFGDIGFMDSSGIGLVMGRYKLIREFGGKLIIQNVPKGIEKVMKLAGLDRIATMQTTGGNQ